MIRIATVKTWLPALVVLGLLALLLAVLAGSAALQPAPTGAALADIPPTYYALYVQAADDYDTDWEVLAAIGKVETNHGRSKLPGVRSGVNEYGCCAGPMQFAVSQAAGCRVCVGDTWGAYGIDGNEDGRRNVYDPRDAIPGAANYTRGVRYSLSATGPGGRPIANAQFSSSNGMTEALDLLGAMCQQLQNDEFTGEACEAAVNAGLPKVTAQKPVTPKLPNGNVLQLSGNTAGGAFTMDLNPNYESWRICDRIHRAAPVLAVRCVLKDRASC